MKHLNTTLESYSYRPLLKTTNIRVTGSRQARSTHIGIVPEGSEGRQVFQGPLVPGPWGFTVQHPTVIDNFGGSAAERERMIVELAVGEPFTVEGLPGVWELVDRDQGRLEGEGVKLIPHNETELSI